MSCKNATGEFLFDAEAEVTSNNHHRHKLGPAEKGTHFARCYNDGTFSRRVTIKSKCQGPRLNFGGKTEVYLATNEEVFPTLKSTGPWQSPDEEVSYERADKARRRSRKEMIVVRIETSNMVGRFRSPMRPIQLALKLEP